MDDMSRRIKTLRQEKGLTLEEIGNKVGVGKSTVRKWENGIIENMRRDKISKLAEALGVTPSYLMGWPDSTAASSGTILSPDESDLIDDYRLLNQEGKQEARKQVRNLTKIEDYTKDTGSSRKQA